MRPISGKMYWAHDNKSRVIDICRALSAKEMIEMQTLQNKIVLITGAASGVGLGMAQAFLAQGAKLILTDFNAQRLCEVKDQLSALGSVETHVLDVRNAEAIQQLSDLVFDTYGRLDILCNNAGVACHGLLWEQSVQECDWIIQTNIYSVLHGLRAFVPRMLTQDSPAHIVNTSSMLGLSSAPLAGLYGASKQAILGITETLYLDLMLSGAEIGVSLLCPGPVNTNVNEEPGRPSISHNKLPDTLNDIGIALKSAISDGMDPREVGEYVTQAVLDNRFWVLPAPDYISNADARLSTIHSQLAEQADAMAQA